MRDDSELIDQFPPGPSLTSEEQATLLANLAAAYAVEYSQEEPMADYAAQSMTDPTALAEAILDRRAAARDAEGAPATAPAESSPRALLPQAIEHVLIVRGELPARLLRRLQSRRGVL